MKTKKFTKKLLLNKTTVTNLSNDESKKILGGNNTAEFTSCPEACLCLSDYDCYTNQANCTYIPFTCPVSYFC